MRIAAWWTVAVVVALLGWEAQVMAASGEDPETLIRQGNELRRRGDDVRAHGYFKRAYEISQTPRSTAQLGLSFYAIRQYPPAEDFLSKALATDDPWVDSQRAILEKARAEVRTHLGAVSVVGAPAGAAVAVSDRPPSPLPPDGVVWVAPGQSTLRIESAGHEALSRKVTVAAGERATLRFDAPALVTPDVPATGESRSPATPAPAVPAAPEVPAPAADLGPSPGRSARIAAVVLAGVGVAAGVTGVVMHSIASTKLAAINSEAASGARYDESNGAWRTYDRLGVGLLVGGAAVLVTGAALFIVNWPAAHGGSEKQVSFALAPDATGGGTLQILGRF